MHGSWTELEDHFVATIRLGTNLTWKQIAVEFNKRFKEASHKDLESRFNKNLKPQIDKPKDARRIADIIDDYRHYRQVDPEEQHVIDASIAILEQYPDHRLW